MLKKKEYTKMSSLFFANKRKIIIALVTFSFALGASVQAQSSVADAVHLRHAQMFMEVIGIQPSQEQDAQKILLKSMKKRVKAYKNLRRVNGRPGQAFEELKKIQRRERRINSERTKKRYECVKGTVSKRRSSNTIKRYKVSLVFKEFSKRKKKKYLFYLATSVFAISKCNFARNDLKLCESTSSSDVAAILNAPVFVKK